MSPNEVSTKPGVAQPGFSECGGAGSGARRRYDMDMLVLRVKRLGMGSKAAVVW
jgi:hypothetical protein